MKKINALNGQGFAHPVASQSDILINHKSEPRIDSRLISERAGIQHESLSATIKSHQSRLRELGSLPRQSLKELTDLISGKGQGFKSSPLAGAVVTSLRPYRPERRVPLQAASLSIWPFSHCNPQG